MKIQNPPASELRIYNLLMLLCCGSYVASGASFFLIFFTFRSSSGRMTMFLVCLTPLLFFLSHGIWARAQLHKKPLPVTIYTESFTPTLKTGARAVVRIRLYLAMVSHMEFAQQLIRSAINRALALHFDELNTLPTISETASELIPTVREQAIELKPKLLEFEIESILLQKTDAFSDGVAVDVKTP